jgi:hypothetical protein
MLPFPTDNPHLSSSKFLTKTLSDVPGMAICQDVSISMQSSEKRVFLNKSANKNRAEITSKEGRYG